MPGNFLPEDIDLREKGSSETEGRDEKTPPGVPEQPRGGVVGDPGRAGRQPTATRG